MAVSLWFIETTLAGWVLAFISVCLETRWLGPYSGFDVPEQPCNVLDSLADLLKIMKLRGVGADDVTSEKYTRYTVVCQFHKLL